MNDAPAFDFYPERWLVGVAGMTDAEQLAYLRLLCHQWLMDGLPADFAALKRLAGRGVTEAVLSKLPVGEDGRRRNRRLEIIRGEQRQRIAKAQEKGRKMAAGRWSKGTQGDACSNAQALLKHEPSMPQAMHKECPPLTTHHSPQSFTPELSLPLERNEAGPGPGVRDSGGGRAEEPEASLTGFDPERVRLIDSILTAYPANGNAMEARRALAMINASPAELRAILAKTQALAAKWRQLPESERRYCPGKHTFFGERRWEDDPNAKPWAGANPAAGIPQMPPLQPGKWARPSLKTQTATATP
jgi:hypothetical protein